MFSRTISILIVCIMLIVIGVVQQVTADTSELPRIRPIPLMRFEGAFIGSSTDLVVYVWYIEGANSRIIVDAGMVETEGIEMGGWVLSSLDDGLARVGLTPEDVDIVIFTHLHPDHVGHAKRFTNARLIVQSADLENALREEHPSFDLVKDLDFETISGDQQIDDNVSVLLTPGHTPGGQSVVVETAAGKVVITAFCTTMDHFEPTITPPPRTKDPDQLTESMQRVAEIADILVPLHDHSFADIDAIPEPKDFSNVFFMPLAPGLNMISLPLEPITPYTAQSFAEEIGATVVIKYDTTLGRFVGFTPVASGDGFPLNGGEGYIVNVPTGGTVAFTGAAWTNGPPVEAAPPAKRESGWAFVFSGSVLDSDGMSPSDGRYTVTARNLRTDEVAIDAIKANRFHAVFADLDRNAVVEAGDKVEVIIRDSANRIVAGPVTHQIGSEDIRRAFRDMVIPYGYARPEKSVLLQNYPNPFNPETWIPFHLSREADVNVRIYDSVGRLIRNLALGNKSEGIYLDKSKAAYWDGKNDAGEEVASGIYYYSITAGDFSPTRKMTVKR